LSLGAITRAAGTTLAVNLGTSPTGFTTTTTANTGTSILGGWAVAGATVPTGWAVSAGNGTTAGAISTLGTYLDTTTAGNTAANYLTTSNVDVTSTPTIAAGVTINSLRFNTSGGNTLNLTGTNTINTGGILMTNGVGSNNQTITGGTIRGSASGELIVHNYGTSANRTLTISSIIANNGGATGLTIMGTTGTVALRTSTNSYTGQTVINGGTLSIDANARIATSSGVTLNGGTLAHATGNFNMDRAITLGLAGGTLSNGLTDAAGGWSSTTAVAFAGSGPRTLTFSITSTGRLDTFAAAIGDGGGPTSLVFNGGNATSFLVLNPNGSSTYSGTTTISQGVLRLSSANAIGGGLLNAATTGNIIFAATGANRAILETGTTAGTITRSVGYGAGQIHWEGNGGFSNVSAATQVVNLGGAGAQLTWGVGGFVPTGQRLQFGQSSNNSNFGLGTIDFQNAIALGTAVRTIEAERALGTTTDRSSAILEGIISGAITSGAGGGLAKEGTGTIMLTGANSSGTATVAVNAGALYFGSTGAIPGTGTNITLSTTVNGNAAIGVAGDTNPTATFAGRIANAGTSTATFLLGADSSAALDFSSYPNMRLAALAFQNASTTPIPLATAVTFTGSITPAGGAYRFGGLLAIQNTNAAASTLVLGRKNILTGANGLDISNGALTITAANSFTGGTVITGGANGTTSIPLGIGDNAALGTGVISLQGASRWVFGAVNGDHSISNNISISDLSSATTWMAGAGGGTSEYSILNNTNQKTLTYLGTVDLGGRAAAQAIAGNVSGTLFLGDIASAGNTVTLSTGSGGYLSLLTATANGGVAKTYAQNTTLADNTNIVIDSASSFGASGAITLGTSLILLQPGTSAVTLTRNFVNTAAKNPSFNIAEGSTLTLRGTMSGSTTGTFVKQGTGTLVLAGDATALLTTGSVQLRSGTLRLDAATFGGTVLTNVGITLGSYGVVANATSNYGNGATLEITGASAQSFGTLTVNPRANNINLTGAMTLTLGAINRTTTSTLNFLVPTATVTTTGAAIAGLVNGSTTWNGNDWAGVTGSGPSSIGAYTGYTTLSGVGPTIASNATANYLLTTGGSGDVTLGAPGTLGTPNNTNTLKFSDTNARTIDLGSGFLRLGTGGAAGGGVTNAGGILVASGSGALTITGGSLMAGGTTTNTLGDLVFINNSTNDITVSSAIVNNNGTTGATQVVYDGRSTGKLILSGANTFTGAISINRGVLEVTTLNSVAFAGSLGQGTAASGNILLNGGTFRANLSADGATDKGFTVQGPSTIEVVLNTLTLNTTLNGPGATSSDIYQNALLFAGILKKTGAGTLELKDLAVNANNANLSIEVVAGTLLLNKTTTDNVAAASLISAIDLAGGAGLIINSVASGAAPTVLISGSGGNQISNTSSVVVRGDLAIKGVFDLNGLSETIDGLAGTGTVINNVVGTSTLSVGGNNSAGISAYTLAAAAAGVNATGLNNFGGVIQDGGAGKVMALTKIGSGTQILTGLNTYSGGTTISAGTLQLGIANALPSGAGKANVLVVGTNVGTNVGNVATNGSDKVFAPGTLDMGGFDQGINGLNSSTGGFVTNNPLLAFDGSAWTVALARQGAKTLALGNGNASGDFNGVIQDGFSVAPGVTATGYVGGINLVKTGSGTQILSGANLYTGSTAIQNGVLVISGGTNRLPATTAVTLGSGGTSGILQVGGATTVTQTITGLAISGSGGTSNKVVGGNASNSRLILSQTGSATYSGGIGGGGTNENQLDFTLQGGGTLTLDGINSHTGTTTIQGGSTLVLGTGITSSTVSVGGAGGGTLTGAGFTIGGLTTVNSGGVIAPGATSASSAIGTLSFSNGLTINGGSLAFVLGSTSGGSPLQGDLINVTGGGFNVTAGTISLNDLGGANGVILGTYDILDYTGTTFTGFGNLTLSSSVIGSNNYVATLFNNTGSNKLQVVLDNARFWAAQTNGLWDVNTTANWNPGSFFLTGDKVIFADLSPTLAPGTTNIVLNSSVTPGAVSFTNATLDYVLSGSGAIIGATGISKSGAGAVAISLNNTFTGNTSISGGSIEMRQAGALGTSGSVSVSGTGELRLSGDIAVGAKALTLNGTGASSTGALRNLSGSNGYAGAITLSGASRIHSDAGTLTLSGGITNGSNNLTFGGAGNITESGVIGSGAGTLTVDGTGIVTLSNAANTYTGQTFVKRGTLSVSNIGNLSAAGGLGAPTSIANGTIALGDAANTGTLQWNGSSNETTDRVIDLAGTTGGATLDASGAGALTLSSAFTFTGAGSKTLTLTGIGGTTGTPNVISGGIADPSAFATSLVKTGTGVWRLDGSNTYTGSSAINGGTLLLGLADGLPISALTIANGTSNATLNLNGLSQTLNGVTFGGVSATRAAQGNIVTGAGVLTLGGDITYSAIGNPLGASISGNVDLGGAVRALNIAQSSSASGAELTLSAIIADSSATGSLAKTGSGTALLTGANTYVGETKVDGGTLSVTPAAIATTGAINIGANGTNGAVNLYADNAIATAALAPGTNLNVGGTGSSGGLGFQLSGATGDRINLAGSGALTVGAGGGIINARALAALAPGSFILLDTTNTGPTSVTGFTLGVLTGGYTYALDTSSTVGQLKLTVGAANAGPYYWNGSLGSGGNGSWATLATGGNSTNWRLNANGTGEAGATPGAVDVYFATDTATNISTTLDQPYAITGLKFVANTSGTGNVTIAPGSGDGTLTIGANGIDVQASATSASTTITAPVILGAAQAWNVNDLAQTLTISGRVSGSSNLLTKTGAGTLVLSGANTYNGGITLNGGTVQINSASSLGAAAGTLTINAATLQATADITEIRNVVLGDTGTTILVDATKTLSIVNTGSTLVSSTGRLNATGAGTLVLDDRLNANTFSGGSILSGGTVQVYTVTGLGSGATTINAGTLRVSGTYSDSRGFFLGNAASAISVDSGKVLTIANTVSSNITSTGTLNASGAGTLILDDALLANDFSGGSILSGSGTVRISTTTGLGSGAITINDATLNATATISHTARNYTLGNASSTLNVDSGSTYTITNSVSTKITGAGKLNANGSGILVIDDLANANDFSGGSLFSGGGTVKIATATSLGVETGSATLKDATLQATADITTSRDFTLASYVAGISVDAAKTFILSGLLNDGLPTGTLNKTGTGTLNLTRSAGNTYTGGTFVTSGTLLVNNTSNSGTGTGAVSIIGTGTTLGGAGIISGAVSLGSGSILAPGNSAGTLTVGSLTLSAGTILNYELAAPGSSDKTVVTTSNGFTANGGQFNLTGLAGLANGTYNLITYSGTLGGSFSNLSLASNYVTGGGNAFYVTLANNTGSVDLITTNAMAWNGNVAGTIWESGATANTNWKIGPTTGLSFFDSMTATFDDTATAFTVNVPGNVAPSAITVNAANDYVFQGAGAITGNTGITKSNSGGLTIDTVNSFTGNTAINAGFIQMQNVSSLGSGGSITIASGASLLVNTAAGLDFGARITSLSGTGFDGNGAIQNLAGNNVITGPFTITSSTRIGAQAGTLTVGGNITGSSQALALAASGTGSITLTGTSISIANASFTVNNTGSGTVTVANTVGVGTSGVVLNGSGITILNGAITSSSTGNGLSISSSGTNTINANVAVSGTAGGLTIAGSGTNTFGAASNTSWSGTGTATISSSGNTTFNGTISGAGALTKSGAGTLTFNASSNSYTGAVSFTAAVNVNSGLIIANATNALGTGAVTLTSTTSPTPPTDALKVQLQLNGGITLGNSSFTTTGPGTDGTVSGLIRSVTGANNISGSIIMATGGGATTLRADSGASLALNGNVTSNTPGRYLALVGAGNFTAASINDNGVNTVGFWAANSGTVNLTGIANSYTLMTGITGGSTLNIAALANINTNSSIGKGSVSGSADDLSIDNGTLRYTGGTAQSTDRLFNIGTGGATIDASGSAALSFTNSSSLGLKSITAVGSLASTAGVRTLTLTGSNTGNNTLASQINDNGGATALVKTGLGKWVITGTNGYTGNTSVTGGGTLVFSSSLGDVNATNTITLAGSTLNYTGSTGLNLGANRTLKLDAGTSTVDVSSAAAVLSFGSFNATSTGNLVKAGAGSLVLNGTTNLNGGTTTVSGGVLSTGFGASGTSAISVAAGSSLYNVDAGATMLVLPSTGSLTLNAGASLATASKLGFGLNTTSAAGITLDAASTLTLNGTGTIYLGLSSLGTALTVGDYNLITSPVADLLAGGGVSYALDNVIGGYTYSLSQTSGLVKVSVLAAYSGDLYWHGDLAGPAGSWTNYRSGNTNWLNGLTGGTDLGATPGSQNTVVFSATEASGASVSTSLDGDVSIKNLLFNSNPAGVTAATVAQGAFGVLTITPTDSATGIDVADNAGAVTISAPVALGASQTWNVVGTGANGSSLAVSGGITGGALNTLTKTGGGVFTLTGNNTFSGATTVSAGTLLANSVSTLSPNSILTVSGSGRLLSGTTNAFNANGSLVVNGTGTVRLNGFSNVIAALSGSGGVVENNHASNAATLTVGDATDKTFSGTIQNGAAAGLALTKVGGGRLTLDGIYTHTGATTVNAGTLRFAGTNSGTTTVTANNTGSVIQIGSATGLSVNNAVSITVGTLLDLFGNSVTIGTLTNVAGATITNTSTGAHASTASTSGSPTLTDALTISPQSITVAALVTDGTNRKTQLVVNNVNSSTKITTNTANTFSGGLVLANNASGTRLVIGTITGTPWGSGPIIVGQSATDRAGIFFDAANQTLTNAIVMNTALGTDRVGIRIDATGMILSGQITANLAPVVFSSNGTGAATLTGKITGASGLILDSATSGTAITITLNNASANNDYAGDTVIGQNAAAARNRTVVLGAADQLPNGAGKGNVIINTNSTGVGLLNLAGFSETINGLSGNGTVDGTSGTPTLTVGDGDTTATFSGIIQNTAGTLTLTKIGTGTQTLSGASTFAGPVNVNGGLIAFTSAAATGGALGNSTVVNLNGGGISYTATGTNALNRPIAIGAGNGTVYVSNPAGILTIASVTSAGGNLIKTGLGAAQIEGGTTLNAGNAGVNVSEGTLQAGFGANGIATLTVGATGNMNFNNGTIEALTLANAAGALTLQSGARLGFELTNTLTNDSITLGATGTAVAAGTITLDFFGTIAVGTYNLINAALGGLNPGGNTVNYVLGSGPSGFNYSITATDTLVSVTTSILSNIYWTNSESTGSWTTMTSSPSNFSLNADGTGNTNQVPQTADTVIFSSTAVTVGASPINMTLDAAHTVDSLKFIGQPAGATYSITSGTGGVASTLTLAPVSSTNGIAIAADGGAVTIGAPLIVNKSQTWSVDGTGASSLAITGDVTFNSSFTVTKSGAGVLTLSGTNTGDGNFTLVGGTLNLNNSAAIGAGTFTIGDATTLNNTSAGLVTLSNTAQNWNGSFTYTGGSQSLNLGSGAVALGANVIATISGQTLTVGGGIEDGASTRFLTKDGAGTLILNGANGYDGLTTVSAGVLTLAGNNSNAAGGVTLSAGTLNINHNNALGTGTFTIAASTIINNSSGTAVSNTTNNNAQVWNGSFTFTGGSNLNLGSGNVTLGSSLTVTTSANNLTVGGVIDDGATNTFNLTKAGTGTLTLGGASTYGGTTTINEGILKIGVNNALPTAGVVQLGASTTAGTLDLNGFDLTIGSLSVQTNSTTATNSIVVGTGKTLTINGAVTLGVNANASTTLVTASGGGAILVNSGGANFQVGGATGGTNENTATVDFSDLDSFTANLGTGTFRLGDNNSASSGVAPATLKLASKTTSSSNSITAALVRIGDGSGDGDTTHVLTLGQGTNAINADTINIGSAGANIRSSGSVVFGGSDTTGSLSIRASNGTGAAILNMVNTSGTTAANMNSSVNLNGHTSNLLVSTLTMAARSASTGLASATLSFNQGALAVTTLNMASRTGAGTGNATATLNLGDSVAPGTPTTTIGSLAMAVNTSGGGTSTADIFVTGGNVTIGTGSGTAINMANAVAGRTSTSRIEITGGAVTVNGNIIRSNGGGTENTTLTLNGGTLDMAGFTIGSGSANLSTLNFQSGTLMNVAEINGGLSLIKTVGAGSNTLILEGNNTYTGATTIISGVLQVGSGSTTGNLGSGNVTNNATLAFNRSNSYAVSNIISGTGNVVQAGSGTTSLSGVNTYSGTTTISAGKLAISNENNLGATPGTFFASQLTLNGGTLQATDDVAISTNRGVTVEADSGIEVVGSTKTLTVNSVIVGTAGTLNKTGAGTLVLTAANTYAGTTNVSAGTLQVGNGFTGSLDGTSGVNVTGAGSKLSGSGSIAGGTILGSDTILAPGVGDTNGSNQTLNFTSVEVQNGGQVQLSITNRTEQLGSSDLSALTDALTGGSYTTVAALFATGQLDAYKTTAPGNHDFVNISGTFTINADNLATPLFKVVNRTGFPYTTAAPSVGDVFNLMDWSTLSYSGTNTSLTEANFDFTGAGFTGEFKFDTSAFATHGILVVVPEPSRAFFILIGLLGLMMRRRRRVL
jgi:autotransporter-associated beta strand protein